MLCISLCTTTYAALVDGTYIIKNRFTNKVMQVENQDTFDITQQDRSNATNQQWQVTNIGINGEYLYEIKSLTSRKVLDAFYDENSAEPKAKIIQFAGFGNNNQKWLLTDKGVGTEGNYYTVVNNDSNKAAEIYNADTSNGALISQWDVNNHHVQDWEFIPVIADGTYIIKNRSTNKVMDVLNNDITNGATIIQFPELSGNSAYNQRWSVHQLSDGSYEISAVHSDKTLDVSGGSSSNSAPIIQYQRNNNDNQKWTLAVKGQGSRGVYSSIVNKKTGKALELAYANPADLLPISQYELNGHPVQDWEFIPAALFTDISLHDPSIMKDSQTNKYWIFGSFLTAASSTDLVNWQNETDGINGENTLFGSQSNMQSQFNAGFNWAGASNVQWAADVFELDNQYYYYFNQGVIAGPSDPSPIGQKWGSWGYIGVASSNQIASQYTVLQDSNAVHDIDQLAFLKSSGGSNLTITDPIDVNYNAYIHPNTVDPDVFTDKDGKLWMVYGSYSGGIFMLELDATGTYGQKGKPIPTQHSAINSENSGFGRHILGGDHSRIEAAFMMHSPVTDYYYVFTSFGGLSADGGYNIRVMRSQSVTGPYEDADGYAMNQVRGNDTNIAAHGVKLMGSHRFVNDSDEQQYQLGYQSPGHNSAYYDQVLNKHFLVFHTRFPGFGEAHQVRVHEMYMNSQGWPVVSPLRYLPQQAASSVSSTDLLGDYKLVDHGKDINNFAHYSINVTLASNGTITGDMNGKWQLQGEQLNLTIAGNTYYGVAKWQ